MDLLIQPEFAERVIFAQARSDEVLRRQYEREFADCHERPAAAREEAFRLLHARWFEGLGHAARLRRLAGEFAFVDARLTRLLLRLAPGARMQSLELFGREDMWTVVAALTPAVFLQEPAADYWLRHELSHVDDMLDPAFGYDAGRRPGGSSAGAAQLAHDRFAVLWAVSVDARLEARGTLPVDTRDIRAAEFARVCGRAAPTTSAAAFDALWSEFAGRRPAQSELVERAEAGAEFGGSAREAGHAARPAPGGACPLCTFPTFDWADEAAVALLADRLVERFPAWSPTDGICGRCAELYRGRFGVRRGAGVA